MSESAATESLLGNTSKREVQRYQKDHIAACRTIAACKYVIMGILVFSVSAGIIILALRGVFTSQSNDSDDVKEECYIYPACTTELPPNPNGYTNSTGFALYSEMTYPGSCCNACLPGTNNTVCFDPEGSCKNKTGDGDYDLLLLDEIWIPQFCSALLNGYDPTLSHLDEMTCMYGSSELSLHGLWPNYVDGYPQCCNASGTLAPLDPSSVVEWDIYPQLQLNWYDPTESSDCAVCYLLNHEWEKHGGCYSPGDPLSYFSTGLDLKNQLTAIDEVINSYSGEIVETIMIESLYDKRPSIVCDPNDPMAQQLLANNTGVLLEIQTCWNRTLAQIDCPPAFEGPFTVSCPEKVLLIGYKK